MRTQPTRAPLPPITDITPVHGVVLSVGGDTVDQRNRNGELLWTASRQDQPRYTVTLSFADGNLITIDDAVAANPVVPASQPVICHQPGNPVGGWRVNGVLYVDLREAWDVEDCE